MSGGLKRQHETGFTQRKTGAFRLRFINSSSVLKRALQDLIQPTISVSANQ